MGYPARVQIPRLFLLLMNCCAMQGYIHQDIGFAGYPSSFSQWNAGIHHVQVATSAQLVYNATTTIKISNDVAHILLVIQHQKLVSSIYAQLDLTW